MPEGVAVGGSVISEPTLTDKGQRPPDDPEKAPLGWTWDYKIQSWRPQKRRGGWGHGPTKNKPADPQPEHDQLEHDGQDPDPSWVREDQPAEPEAPKRRLSIADVPKDTVNDIAGFAGLVGAPLLGMLQQIDPYCGTVLANNYQGIVDAALPLICRSEKIVSWFSDDKSDWLLWGKLAMALRPVAQAVLSHHVFRTVEVVKDQNGQLIAVPRTRGQAQMGDHLQPQPQPDYSSAAWAA